MSIYVDGERSRQRLGFAKSLLNKLKMMGMRTKKLIYEGFLYRVDIVAPGLSKIAVTAPMGAFFICMTKTGSRVMKADYYLGLVEPSREHYTASYATSPGFVGGWVYYLGSQETKQAVSGTSVGTPPSPSATVTAGEFTGAWYAYQATGGDPGRVNFDTNLYSSSGSQARAFGYSAATVSTEYIFAQPLPTELFWYAALSTPHPGGQIVKDNNQNTPVAYTLAARIAAGYGGGIPTWYVYNSSVPAGLRSQLNSLSTFVNFRAVGTYGYANGVGEFPVVVQFLDCTSNGLTSYFDANPANQGWMITCSFQDIEANFGVCFPLVDMLENVYNFSSIKGGEDNNFQTTYTPLLYGPIPAKIAAMTLWRTAGKGDGVYDPVYKAIDDGGDPPVIIRYDLEKWVINKTRLLQAARQLMPWPNSSGYAPIDSAMFHTHDDKVFIVTKRYPPVAIDTITGLYRTTVVLPTATLSAGIRPEIFHAGGGVYYCIGRNVAAGTVIGVYIGSPYASWTTLPMPADTLVQVRALECTAARQVFMGVTYNAGYKYHILFMEGGVGAWRYISSLDITTPPEDCSWSMAVYGDDPLVVRMKALLSQPPATQSYLYSPLEPQP